MYVLVLGKLVDESPKIKQNKHMISYTPCQKFSIMQIKIQGIYTD